MKTRYPNLTFFLKWLRSLVQCTTVKSIDTKQNGRINGWGCVNSVTLRERLARLSNPTVAIFSMLADKIFTVCVRYPHRLIRYYKKYGAAKTYNRLRRQLTIIVLSLRSLFPFSHIPATVFWRPTLSGPKSPKVSIIVPNYNHEQYLPERLVSIYSQTYKNYEVILLDDCSTDKSRDILLHYKKAHPEKTRLIFNETNTGKPFLQWQRGIEAAKGDLIWIAESDDYCDTDFLERLVPSFEDEAVSLAYCSTEFMENGEKIWDLGAYLAEFPLNFDNSFMMTAHQFVRSVMFCKNPIANGSSALFRKPVSLPDDFKSTITGMQLCGDWLFYLHIIKGGVISFTRNTKDYYRIHAQSTSLRIQKTKTYFEEQFLVQSYITQNYAVEPEHIDKKYTDILQEYLTTFPDSTTKDLESLFDRNALYENISKRKPNIGMCCFAFSIGGGEFFPIHLANEIKKQGYSVTFLDFDCEARNPTVRASLSPDIPVVYAPHARMFNTIVTQLGLDVLHSHHGTIDDAVCALNNEQRFQHLVTLHGYYEAINNPDRACEIFHKLQAHNTHIVYTADKNIPLAKQAGIDTETLQKVPNGLPAMPIGNLHRESLNLSEDDFVLCLVSRALSTKGWKEATEIVDMVNKKSSRPVHLLLIGEGEMYDELKTCESQYVHCLGNRFDLQGIYALSDMGFFPSRFPGESFPLVNIECLITGTPIIASDIGEIANQLTTDNNGVAGALFQLEDGKIPIAKVADIVLSFIENTQLFEKAKENANELSEKFDIASVAQIYLGRYSLLMQGLNPTTR